MPMSTAAGSGVPSGAPLLRVIILAAILLVVGAPRATAVPAPGGTVEVAQSCAGWSARVELNHKVAPFRTVNVVSTLPGHPGIVDGTYDSTFGLIWLATGSEHDMAGVVTLRISAGTNPVFEASATLIPAEGCEEVTTTTVSTTTTSLPSTLLTPDWSRPAGPVTPPPRETFPVTGWGSMWGFAIGTFLVGVGVEAILWARRAR